jgi:hypothetical protein
MACAILGKRRALLSPTSPEGGPVRVTMPAGSQAFYIRVGPDETFTVEVPPLPRAVPGLVMGDEAGRALEPYARLTCGGETRLLPTLGAAFF